MLYLSHFIHAWLMFVAPLSLLGYKPTVKQRVWFTLVYALGIIFSRKIYDFLPLPFGTHTLILLTLSVILFKKIVKDFSWHKSLSISLMLFIAMLINDSLILLPIMNLLGITVQELADNPLVLLFITAMSNFVFIVIYIIGYFKNRKGKPIYTF